MSGFAIPIPDDLVDGLARAVAKRALELIRDDLDRSSPWMTAEEAIDYLHIPASTFKELASAGKIPRHQDDDRGRFYYHRAELDAWRLGYGPEMSLPNVRRLRDAA